MILIDDKQLKRNDNQLSKPGISNVLDNCWDLHRRSL